MNVKFLQKIGSALLFLGLCAAGNPVKSQTYTFTTAGATGINGPTQTQVSNAYSSTNLAGSVTVTGGIQSWSVPVGGLYKIEVYGANGYGVYGGKGAYMSGEFNFNASDVLKILVGQMGGCCNGAGTNQYGGGGGTFVTTSTNTPLIVAGGGGGAATFYSNVNLASSHNTVADANITTSGKNASGSTNGTGGTNGNGGTTGNTGGGGGGFLTDGSGTQGGLSFLNGGTGGNPTSPTGLGGFGGGGSITGQNNMRAGGGGGYSGGGGCGSSTTVVQIGGGGGSYNSGANQVNTAAMGTGHGLVVITLLQQAVTLPNNVGLTAFPSLANGICPGNQPVSVKIRNFGNNFVGSVNIAWSVNNVLQTNNLYTVALDTFPAPGYDTTITIGTYNFVSGSYAIKAWTSSPNAQVDPAPNNDTSTISLTPRLSGTFTLNSAQATGGTNYQTFTAFVNDLNNSGVCGPVVLNVAPGSGPYNEQVNISQIVGASAANTITINGNGCVLTQTLTGTPTNYATLNLDGADYFTFNDLTVEALGATYGFAVHLMNSADYNSFNNCTFNAAPNTASTTSGCVNMSGSTIVYNTAGTNGSNNTFTGCTTNGGYFGFYFYGSSATSNANNKVINCHIKDFYTFGIYGFSQGTAVYSGNVVERPARTTVTTFNGVYIAGSSTGALVEKNKIRNPFGAITTPATTAAYGIYSTSSGTLGNEHMIVNNLVSDFKNNNGTQGGIYISYCDYVKVHHNTISLDNAASTAGASYGILHPGSNPMGVDIRNNIVYLTRGGTGAKYAIYLYNYQPGVSFISDFNDIYISGTATSYVVWDDWNGIGYTTLAAWRTASGNLADMNTVTFDPLFVSPSTGNYSPSSPNINDIGTPVGVSTDIMNNARSSTNPDPGAYEFLPPPCVAPPTAGTAVLVTTGTICANVPFTLNLTGNSIGGAQSYQWEESIFQAGPYTPVGNPSTLPGTSLSAPSSRYYRCAVTCNFNTQHSIEVFVNVNPALPGGTYTINSALPTGSGNYQTFGDAVSALSCGISGPVVLNVVSGSGPYNEQINIPVIFGASATNTVTFNGNGCVLTRTLTATGTNYATINLDGADYITFNNLTIEALGTSYGFAVHLMNSADNNTFNNCIINASPTATATTSGCVSMSGSPIAYTTAGTNGMNNTFSGCTLTGGYFGFFFYGTAVTGNTNNNILNCTVKDYYVYGSYSYYQGNATISGNVFERPTRTTLSTFYGVALLTGCSNMLVEKNTVRKPATTNPSASFSGYPLYTTAAASLGNENKFYNNLVCNIEGIGIRYALYINGGTYVKAYHNTLVLDNTVTSASAIAGIYATGTAGLDIKNNNIVVAQPSTGIKYGLYYSGAGKTSDHNNVYVNAGGSGASYYGYSSTGTTTTAGTLALWKQYNAASNYDINSLDLNPQFASPGTGNYVYTNMGMDNLGTPMGVTTDIMNNPRDPVVPDMGAYEVPNSPCTSPPTAGTATATPNTAICGGANILLNLAGMSSGSGQTYQWEESFTPGGPFSPVTATLQSPGTTITATSSKYYRVAVTCGASSSYSNEVFVSVGAIGGTASIPSTTVCYGGTASLSLAGHTGNNVQWESYDNATSAWLPIAGATTANYSFINLQSSADFRAAVSCSSPAGTIYSNTLSVIVINPQIVETFPGSRCNAGPVTLAAEGAPGTTVKWYTAPTGGTAVGTGGAYTTPSISSTTTYYAAAASGSGGGIVPELMYYRFDVPGTSVANEASTPVGNNPATVIGLTIGGTGQFGTGLNGTAGATASNRVDPGWTGTHNGSWTISFWMNVPTPPTTRYMFGNSSGNGTFRCFIGGAAGGIRLTGGLPSITLDMPAWQPGANVITYVYNSTLGTVSGYINGVFQASASPGATYPLDGTNFVVGSQGTSIEGTMDEFRMYNRALSAAEVAATWNVTLGGCEGTRVPVAATINGTSSGTGLSTGGTTILTNHPTSTTIDYMDACNDRVATVTNNPAALGNTAAIVLTSPTVKTFAGKPYVPRVFDITPTTNGSATVTLYALQSDFNAYNSYVINNSLGLPLLPANPTDPNAANVRITQFHGAALAGTTGPLGLYNAQNASFITNVTTVWTGQYWAMTFPVTGFSGFFIHTGATPLVIDLKDISAVNVGDRNRIDWSTVSEQNGDLFELERSADGENFAKLANIKAKGEASAYSYWDENPISGINYYRLKLIHTSGNTSYSKVVSAKVRDAGAFTVEAYPNPVSDVLTVKVFGAAGNNATVMITDVTGKIVKMANVSDNNAEINMSGLAQGVYLVKYADSKQSQTIKVNKQ